MELPLSPNLVTKKIRSHAEMIKILVTNIEFYKKSYLIFTEMRYFLKKVLISLDIFPDYFFSKLMLLFDKSTFQTTVSPFSNSKISRITFGIEVDNVPPVDCNFVVYFNFIPPYILSIIFIMIYLVIL